MTMPWRFWITRTKSAASARDSTVPVSSQATPRPRIWASRRPYRRYIWFSVVISSSPRAEGVTRSACLLTPAG